MRQGLLRLAVPLERLFLSPQHPPGEDVLVAIDETEGGTPVLSAHFSGRRRELSDRNLVVALLRHPLMTIKIVAAIHFEALRLRLKRIPVHAHGAANPAKG